MKVAVVGSGISGLGCAWLLNQKHQVTLFEKDARVGGHSRTLDIDTPDGPVAVDTGFIVYNYRNYPLLTQLFRHLNVPTAKSDMSFGVTIDHPQTLRDSRSPWLEYATHNLVAQRRNSVRPAFLKMVADILRFNKRAVQIVEESPDVSLGALLDRMNMGDWFRHYYLLAMGGAIWSSPPEQMLEFPARSLLRFFQNHGLLDHRDKLQWYTVVGGSREYVRRITRDLGGDLCVGCGVDSITRTAEGVEIEDVHGGVHRFDQVVIAAHGDQALAMLANPTAEERSVLGCFRYQSNKVILHSDPEFMPVNRKAWASWVYRSVTRDDADPQISLTYWMNNLQPLATEQPVLVTLNPSEPPRDSLIHDEWETDHPLFDSAAVKAQARIPAIQGADRIWYCGAYQRNGFHEDGFDSAVRVARELGVIPPWESVGDSGEELCSAFVADMVAGSGADLSLPKSGTPEVVTSDGRDYPEQVNPKGRAA